MPTTPLTRDNIDQLLSKWTAQVADESEEGPRVPIKALLGEAIDLAEVVDKNFASKTTHGKTRLGLESVVAQGQIATSTSTELRELQLAAATVQSRYQLLAEQSSNDSLARADELLSEFRAALGFVLEDGTHPHGEEQLNQLRDTFSQENTHDGMAMALEGYSELANQHQADMIQLGGFEVSMIQEALQVAQALRQRSADRLTGQVAQEQRELMRLRNRLLTALTTRMRQARRAIRYVFRDDPEVLRQSASDYRRSARRSSNRSINTPASGVTGDEPTLAGVGTPQVG